MEKIIWTDPVRNDEVLHRVKAERNVIRTMKERIGNWIGHILRRNCLLKDVIEGKTEGRKLWKDVEEDVSGYRMTLSKGEAIVNC
jgi:hypothetical protein